MEAHTLGGYGGVNLKERLGVHFLRVSDALWNTRKHFLVITPQCAPHGVIIVTREQ